MSDSPSVEETVKKIVTRIVRKQEDEYKPSATFKDLKADSLDIVELVMELEDAFSIEIPDEDAEKLKTVQDAIDYLRGRVTETA